MSKHADKGKQAERLVQGCLDTWSKSSISFVWHRLPDARAARGALAAQPCDFLMGFEGRLTLLEVKETQEKVRLPKAKISQYGTLLKWHWAGFRVLVVVHRSSLGDWTYLDKVDLFRYSVCPPSFPFVEGRSYPSEIFLLKDLL